MLGSADQCICFKRYQVDNHSPFVLKALATGLTNINILIPIVSETVWKW